MAASARGRTHGYTLRPGPTGSRAPGQLIGTRNLTTVLDHAKAAPACGYECPVLAGDGGPGSPTDGTGRSGARMADDGSVGAGDHNGRSSAALSRGSAEFLVASIRGGSTGDF